MDTILDVYYIEMMTWNEIYMTEVFLHDDPTFVIPVLQEMSERIEHNRQTMIR